MAALAVLFLADYTVVVLDEHLEAPWRHVCEVVDYSIWAVFLVDYLIRLTLAVDHLRYWYTHLVDLLIIALPVLRPLRLLRLVMLLRVLNRRMFGSMRGQVLIYVVAAAGVVVYCAALAAFDAERHAPDANITSFGQAVWWAIATFCTVGYGDRYPVTGEGRAVATGLMIGGLVLIGALSASFASWLVERARQVDEALEAATRRDVLALRDQITRLEARIEEVLSRQQP